MMIPPLQGKKRIFDVGTGPNGSSWWHQVDAGAQITGIETHFFPTVVPEHVRVYKLDANELAAIEPMLSVDRLTADGTFTSEPVAWLGRFDLIVASHVLEHVVDFPATVAGIARLLEPGGQVYTGFPDARNFTDIFYHLVHPNGGGHIQLLTDEIVTAEFAKHGLRAVRKEIWPDDWMWFEKLYNWKSFLWPENKYLSQEKISYLADVFRRELTQDKGYFYGWEMVFQKG